MNNNLKQLMQLSVLVVLAVACGSGEKKNPQPAPEVVDNSETIKLDYEVRDASSKKRPTWVENPDFWAKDNDKDYDNNRYFSYLTDAKVDREAACSLAKANANADIASEISNYLEKSVGVSKEGNASIDPNNPKTQALREFMEDTLAQKIQAMINGAAILQTYWEKRQYQQIKGAKQDYIGFVCGALIKMDKQRLKTLVDKASEAIVQKADDPDTKENVKKALQSAGENFIKAKQGEI